MVAIGIVVVALVLFGVGFFGLYRPWQLRWGATEEEVGASLPGDEAGAGASDGSRERIAGCASDRECRLKGLGRDTCFP
jgi:hypothetical protein